jgi:hypothetical protein
MNGSYEGRTRECETCGFYTNVHMDCDGCQGSICEACAVSGDREAYCSLACAQSHCEHNDVRVEYFDGGVCGETGYHDTGMIAICRDCGADLTDDEPPAAEPRKGPAVAAALAQAVVA